MTYSEIKSQPLDVKPGDTVYLLVRNFSREVYKVHIMYVLDGHNVKRGDKLIIFRLFGRHQRWWHEFMMDDREFKLARHDAEEIKNNPSR